MITSPDMLRKETVTLLREIDEEMERLETKAREDGLSPLSMPYDNAQYTQLLTAKLLAINTLATLNYGIQKS